jgi:predicted amidohydrolase YtcJ
VLIRRARAWPSAACRERDLTNVPVVDIRLTEDRVAECAPGLRARPGEASVDAAGRAVLPGLHDHHVHLRALAAAQASVPAGPPRVWTAAGLQAALGAADASSPPDAWLRCVGYHESVAGPLDRWALDRMLPHRPVRVQHRTGALWVVNSEGAARLGLDGCDLAGVERDAGGRATGRLWRMDRWLASRIPGSAPSLAAVSARAAALGVTGFTDAAPDATRRDVETLAAAVADAAVVQRVHCMAPADAVPPAGRPPGQPAGRDEARFTLGPVKILLDDDRLPTLPELADRARQAHAADRRSRCTA